MVRGQLADRDSHGKCWYSVKRACLCVFMYRWLAIRLYGWFTDRAVWRPTTWQSVHSLHVTGRSHWPRLASVHDLLPDGVRHCHADVAGVHVTVAYYHCHDVIIIVTMSSSLSWCKCKCTMSNAYTRLNSDQRNDNLAEWHGVHTVLPTTHMFIHEWNEPFCMNFWLGRTVSKWPVWCRVRCKTLTQSIM